MKTVIEMAREVWSAGGVYVGPSEKSLAQFAELVRADEREACAKARENVPMQQEYDVRDQCAAANRARGQS